MITIYANWTGNAASTARTLDEARAKLGPMDCSADTVFGFDPADMTALDTGPTPITAGMRERFDLLSVAREFFPLVSAEGLARIA